MTGFASQNTNLSNFPTLIKFASETLMVSELAIFQNFVTLFRFLASSLHHRHFMIDKVTRHLNVHMHTLNLFESIYCSITLFYFKTDIKKEKI